MIAKLPQRPGVYIFKNKAGTPIYVGKAINLKKRVKDHFSLRGENYKAAQMVEKTKQVQAIEVDSEIEALVLEANLIKKFKPVYNSQWKDDKDYLYIKITRDQFPRVLASRRKDLKNSKKYFGPFPSATKVRATLKTLRKIFPYSTCRSNQKRVCLAFHLGLCPGVCSGKISEKDYKKNIRYLTLFLQGEKNKAIENLEKELRGYSKSFQFEKAERMKKNIEALRYIVRPVRASQEYLEDNIEVIRNRELIELSSLLGLEKPPKRIECYDISNIFGRQAVGSMVVFSKGSPDTDEYRKFKIKTVNGINDVAMMKEVIRRRFGNDWTHPDLLIVDGGRQQLNAAKTVLGDKNLSIPVISLAKRLEEIYTTDKPKPIRLESRSNALKLVQRLRDEAHRFAITYHRSLRNKQALTTN